MFKTILTIFLLIPAATLARSEIIGHISTDPNRPDEKIVQERQIDDNQEESHDDKGSSIGGSSAILYSGNMPIVVPEEQEEQEEEQPIVLGFDRLPEDALVRDESGRIYIIRGDIKVVIWDLEELYQYRDQVIMDLPDAVLAEYPTRRFFSGKLIRQIEATAVYVVEKGVKRHIKSIEELARGYHGKTIYNIPAFELTLY